MLVSEAVPEISGKLEYSAVVPSGTEIVEDGAVLSIIIEALSARLEVVGSGSTVSLA